MLERFLKAISNIDKKRIYDIAYSIAYVEKYSTRPINLDSLANIPYFSEIGKANGTELPRARLKRLLCDIITIYLVQENGIEVENKYSKNVLSIIKLIKPEVRFIDGTYKTEEESDALFERLLGYFINKTEWAELVRFEKITKELIANIGSSYLTTEILKRTSKSATVNIKTDIYGTYNPEQVRDINTEIEKIKYSFLMTVIQAFVDEMNKLAKENRASAGLVFNTLRGYNIQLGTGYCGKIPLVICKTDISQHREIRQYFGAILTNNLDQDLRDLKTALSILKLSVDCNVTIRSIIKIDMYLKEFNDYEL